MLTLTITHQLLRKLTPDAPRMDLMGEEALHKISDKAGIEIPQDKSYGITMAGDIISNAGYYALAGIGGKKHAVVRGGLFGLIAGVGGVLLPKHLDLTNEYSNRTNPTVLLTIAIYTVGGLVAGKLMTEGKGA